jgi:hypothetical protein
MNMKLPKIPGPPWRTLAALCVLCAPGAAQAEGWSVIDFDPVPDRASCMSQADTTLRTYRARFDAPGFTARSDWTLGGYDLKGDPIDALFICADEQGRVEPFLVLYNTDDDSHARETVADRLSVIWDEVAAGRNTTVAAARPGKSR